MSVIFSLVLHPLALGEDVPARTTEFDLCVYGGTSAGVIAAVQAAMMGKTVVLIEPGKHLGGLTSGGLGFVDVGDDKVIGGLAREYFHRVWQHYQRDDAWKWEKKHFIQGQHGKLPEGAEVMYIVEPTVAERLFDEMAAEAKVTVVRGERLDRKTGVKKEGARLSQITMESGRAFRAKMFIDATYEGDLMAAAGVSYFVGREANAQYGETINGLRNPKPPILLTKPLNAAGLPRVRPLPTAPIGSADKGVQAYCYRMCLTDVPGNRIMIEKPADYDEREYEIVIRAIEAGQPKDRFIKLSLMPNRKTDSNNHSSISTDYIGMSWDYPEADYATRRKIEQAHERWQRGLMWTLQNHPRVPEDVRKFHKPWGLPKDEFTDNNHWSHQLYVREARRMIGEYVVTENDCLGQRRVDDSVGMGSYMMDSHSIQYCAGPDGLLLSEGGMGVRLKGPYGISYRAIVPKRAECENLFVPVCLSATHAAYGSIRMEPVFMILGQSAATAAVMAIDDGVAVQQVDAGKLRARLLADKQVLDRKTTPPPPAAAGIDVDDAQATTQGQWSASTSGTQFAGVGYVHDGNADKGAKAIRFTPDLPAEGTYDVIMLWSQHANRATNVPIEIVHAAGTAKLTINQRDKGGWVKVFTGKFKSGREGSLVIRTTGTDGYVVADSVRWVPAKDR